MTWKNSEFLIPLSSLLSAGLGVPDTEVHLMVLPQGDNGDSGHLVGSVKELGLYSCIVTNCLTGNLWG